MKKHVLFLTALSLMSLPLFGCGGFWNKNSVHTRANEQTDHYNAGAFTYAADQVEKVEVNWVSGSVTLKESKENTLSVSETGSLSEKQQLHWLLEDGVLYIRFCASGYVGAFPPNSKDLTVELPAGVTLTVDSVSGSIEVGSHTLEEAELSTVSGSIRGKGIEAKEIQLKSISGSIRLDSLKAQEEVQLESTSGSIETETLEAPEIEVDTVSGSVRLGLKGCKKAVLDSTSGSLYVKLLEGQGVAVTYKSTSGKFHADSYRVEQGRMLFGDGSCTLKARTVSGSLTVE